MTGLNRSGSLTWRPRLAPGTMRPVVTSRVPETERSRCEPLSPFARQIDRPIGWSKINPIETERSRPIVHTKLRQQGRFRTILPRFLCHNIESGITVGRIVHRPEIPIRSHGKAVIGPAHQNNPRPPPVVPGPPPLRQLLQEADRRPGLSDPATSAVRPNRGAVNAGRILTEGDKPVSHRSGNSP